MLLIRNRATTFNLEPLISVPEFVLVVLVVVLVVLVVVLVVVVVASHYYYYYNYYYYYYYYYYGFVHLFVAPGWRWGAESVCV